MSPIDEYLRQQSRRHFFKSTGLAVGRIALAGMMFPELAKAAATTVKAVPRAHPALPGLPHFAPKAKRLIYLFMNGGPSQMDLLDYKPGLEKIFDTDLPESIRMGQRLTTMTSGQSRFPIAPSIYQFKQYGKSGTWFKPGTWATPPSLMTHSMPLRSWNRIFCCRLMASLRRSASFIARLLRARLPPDRPRQFAQQSIPGT